MINVSDLTYRYEYRSKTFRALGLFLVLLMFVIALDLVFDGPHVLNISFAILCLIVAVSQVYAWIFKKNKYLEIDGKTIEWGTTGGKTKNIYFTDISKIGFGYGGVEDHQLMIKERSGKIHSIGDVFYFRENDKVEEVLYHYQAKYGYTIVRANDIFPIFY